MDDLFDEMNLDEAQARRENQQFINTEGLFEIPSPTPPLPGMENMPNMVLSLPAYDFEDHIVHIDTHNGLRKSPRYRKMTEPLRKGLDAHVKIHENFAMCVPVIPPGQKPVHPRLHLPPPPIPGGPPTQIGAPPPGLPGVPGPGGLPGQGVLPPSPPMAGQPLPPMGLA